MSSPTLRLRMAMASALTLLTLSACAPSLKGAPDNLVLPPVPADIQACLASEPTVFPNAKNLTSAALLRLVARLRASEIEKLSCGRRLLAWYEDLRATVR